LGRLEVQPVGFPIEVPFVDCIKLFENILDEAIGFAGNDRSIDPGRDPKTQAAVGPLTLNRNLNRTPTIAGECMDDASLGMGPSLNPGGTGGVTGHAAKRNFGWIVVWIARANQELSVEP